MEINGHVLVDNRILDIAFAPEVVYLPARNGHPGGLYDSKGNPIPQAISHRGDEVRLSQPIANDIDLSNLPIIQSDLPYFFIGEINPHFGHFLVESTARLWPLLYLSSAFTGNYLYFGQNASTAPLNKAFIKSIFGGFSLNTQDFVAYRKPCKLRNVLIAYPAFEIRLQGSPAFRQSMQHIGDTLTNNGLADISNTNQTPLYLSKSKLTKGLSGIINETAIEDSLRKKGVDIWHPETVDLPTQIRELSSRKYIIGSVGSAFHSLLFCPGDKVISGIVLDRKVNSNYVIIDQLCGNIGRYKSGQSLGITLSKDAALCSHSGLKRSFYATEPERVSEALLRDIKL
ncbi:MAG: glycosyltransferase family 61 protein [Methylovulum sp.]|nr:glycosyltransferase family 61 protein [Methylovulum sp.]